MQLTSNRSLKVKNLCFKGVLQLRLQGATESAQPVGPQQGFKLPELLSEQEFRARTNLSDRKFLLLALLSLLLWQRHKAAAAIDQPQPSIVARQVRYRPGLQPCMLMRVCVSKEAWPQGWQVTHSHRALIGQKEMLGNVQQPQMSAKCCEVTTPVLVSGRPVPTHPSACDHLQHHLHHLHRSVRLGVLNRGSLFL